MCDRKHSSRGLSRFHLFCFLALYSYLLVLASPEVASASTVSTPIYDSKSIMSTARTEETTAESMASNPGVQKEVKRRWVSYIWDTFDKSPEERWLMFKLDTAILTFASLGKCIHGPPSLSVLNKPFFHQDTLSNIWIRSTLTMLSYPE